MYFFWITVGPSTMRIWAQMRDFGGDGMTDMMDMEPLESTSTGS